MKAKPALLHPLQYQSTPGMAPVPQDTTVYREPKLQLGVLQGPSATALVLALKLTVLTAPLVSTAEDTTTHMLLGRVRLGISVHKAPEQMCPSPMDTCALRHINVLRELQIHESVMQVSKLKQKRYESVGHGRFNMLTSKLTSLLL